MKNTHSQPNPFYSQVPIVNSNSLPIHFVGIGDPGANVAEHFYKKGIAAKYSCITTNERGPLPEAFNFINFSYPEEKPFAHPDNEFAALQEAFVIPKAVKKLFDSNEYFVLLAGLGGSTGTLLTTYITQLLHQQSKPFLAVCSFPLKYEMQKKLMLARDAVEQLRDVNSFKCIYLDDISAKSAGLSVSGFFDQVSAHFLELYKTETSQISL